MAGKQVQRRRGSTAQHAVFTGALGEITVDTDKKTAVVHDGVTVGGIPLARKSDSDTVAAAAATADAKADAAQGTANTGVANAATAQAEVDALEGVVTANFALTVPRDSTTGAAALPTGTTAQRPGAPIEGQLRFNSQLGVFEGYQSGAWTQVGFDSAVYQRTNILGTVSQSGGVPTGAIIESGSNANGTYTKFADGTLVCRIYTSATVSVSISYGTGYYGTLGWPFPQSFVATPSVSALFIGSAGVLLPNLTALSNSAANLIAFNPSGSSLGSITVFYSLLAIGRWF